MAKAAKKKPSVGKKIVDEAPVDLFTARSKEGVAYRLRKLFSCPVTILSVHKNSCSMNFFLDEFMRRELLSFHQQGRTTSRLHLH